MYWKLSYPIQPDSIHKAKTIVKYFIYKKPDTLQKARQFLLRFYIQKSWRFTLRNLSWKLWSWRLYTKSMTLCVTRRFYIQKSGHLVKNKTICVTFLYTKIRTLCVTRFFIEFLKLMEGVGHFYLQKTTHFALSFYIYKAWHFALHFYMQKTMHFALRFYIQNLSYSTDT